MDGAAHKACLGVLGKELFDEVEEEFGLQRFFHEAGGSLGAGEFALLRAGGDDDDGEGGMDGHEALEGGPAILSRHVQVEENEVRHFLANGGDGGAAVLGFMDAVALGIEQVPQGGTDAGIIIHDEDASGCASLMQAGICRERLHAALVWSAGGVKCRGGNAARRLPSIAASCARMASTMASKWRG